LYGGTTSINGICLDTSKTEYDSRYTSALRVDPQQVDIVKSWPVPRDRAAVQKFWGLANYFRKFIMGWASLVSALQLLLKHDDKF